MALGDAWDVLTSASIAKLNTVNAIWGTGAYLASLDKSKHKLLICTSTGSGFTVNHVYLCTADGLSTVDLSTMVAHTHTGSTDGGDWLDVAIANPEVIDLWLTKTNDMVKANWIETVTGTGSIEDHTDASSIRAIRLRPNGTSGSGATIRYPSPLNLGFAINSTCIFTTQFETASSLAFHGGINCDDVTAADSNTIKYNAEVCTATNNNWFIRSANGSSNSTSDTGTAMTANRVGIRLKHSPTLGTPEVTISIDAAASFQKTTHIPTSGSSTTNNLVKFSQKNNTASDRPCKFYGARVTYVTTSSWGYNAFI